MVAMTTIPLFTTPNQMVKKSIQSGSHINPHGTRSSSRSANGVRVRKTFKCSQRTFFIIMSGPSGIEKHCFYSHLRTRLALLSSGAMPMKHHLS